MIARPWWFVVVVALVIAALALVDASLAGASRAGDVQAGSFASDNARAMDTMMAAMSVAPRGDPDRDFVATMVPHHQGAVDMALAELRYGKNETLRRMAQEIIVEQKQEIDAMRLAAGRLPVSTATGAASVDICTARSTPHPLREAFASEGH